ncbi:MAG: helicase-related protein [Anaerolineales bacterium]
MAYSVGSLVRARGREWVVLPESREDFLVLRPLGGTEDEVAGIHLDLEQVEAAVFGPPDPSNVGDHRSARLLRDAVRLGFRSSAGPFRSFGQISVEPRPYQLVPLLMALKLDPVRILISDDVGIGKTIEAGLIARELLDRGEESRLTVLCPPPLAEQWQSELREKFHIDAVLVLPGTARRLERETSFGESLFEAYPFTVVSTDFIKSEHRRNEFLRTCPDLVIVDEAHTCASASVARGAKHLRHELVSSLAKKADRHLILVTATPHSGKEEAFRSLLAFLDENLAELPDDLSGPENKPQRRHLAQHFVQRRRADIEYFMQEKTPFPKRESKEETYELSDEYKGLFHRVLEYARESVLDDSGEVFRQRVRWWSALALLRSLASSPAAAAATLRSRAAVADAENEEDVEEIGRKSVLDLVEDESVEGTDVVPGGDIGELAEDEEKNRRRLLSMARLADDLQGEKDVKLQKAIDLVKDFLKDDFNPILFCRFIPTAHYVAEHLREALPGDVQVIPITGKLAPEDRKARIADLDQDRPRVLVCTDCLSEGINLQQSFDAVMHYDLSWNPTRHEQREGRVDRFGQSEEVVRTLTYYGVDNQIDGVVIDVLLRKHQSIRKALGISVPVPGDVDQIVEALFEGLLLRGGGDLTARYLPGFEEFIKPKKEELYEAWEAAQEREHRSRTMFAQETIKPEEVAQELKLAREAVGSGVDVARFTLEALKAHGGVYEQMNGLYRFEINEVPQALREMMGVSDAFEARFELPIKGDQVYLSRTNPVIEGLSSYVMDTALDPLVDSVARRCGAIRTRAVQQRTTLLLIRMRFHIIQNINGQEIPLLAEDVLATAFEGSPVEPSWLPQERAEDLLRANPDANITYEQASDFIRAVLGDLPELINHLNQLAESRGEEILESHMRVRESAKLRGRRPRIEPNLPSDILGIYVFLPVPQGE